MRITYPAAEAAVGEFGKHGSLCKAACEGLGYTNAKARGSLKLKEFLEHVISLKSNIDLIKLRYQVDINPSTHYLQNRGFGVHLSNIELELARLYLVDGVTYEKAEATVGIKGRKGFETMYSICKIGALRGKLERKSMTATEFIERLDILSRHI